MLWLLVFQGLSGVVRTVLAHFHTPFDRIPNSAGGWANDVLMLMTIPLIASLLIGVAGCDRPVRSAMIAYLTTFGIQQFVWIASVATSGVLFSSGTAVANLGLALLSGIPPAVVAAVAAWCIGRRPAQIARDVRSETADRDKKELCGR